MTNTSRIGWALAVALGSGCALGTESKHASASEPLEEVYYATYLCDDTETIQGIARGYYVDDVLDGAPPTLRYQVRCEQTQPVECAPGLQVRITGPSESELWEGASCDLAVCCEDRTLAPNTPPQPPLAELGDFIVD